MAVVGVELILKNLHMLIDENADYGEVPDRQVLSAE
jgi:hypothetical protein